MSEETTTTTTTETPNAPPANTQPLLAEGGTPAAGEHDWMPEKFRVMADGKLDESASARKLAESYTALEKHKGQMGTVPETPEGYKLEAPKDAEGKPIEGVDMEAFVKDPMFQGIAAKAHAAGMSNEQLNVMVGEYLQLAPQLFAADKQLTVDEARAALSKVEGWGDKEGFSKNLQGAYKVAQAYGLPDGADGSRPVGATSTLMEKFGNDPDFMAFLARISPELNEDKGIPSDGVTASSETDIEALMKSPAYWNKNDPQHTATVQKVTKHFERKHGTAARGRV